MICAHVLGLIDAGSFADSPRRHLEAAWQHARQCATCGRAMDVATELTEGLRALPQPPTPSSMTANVLARIAALPLASGEAPKDIFTAGRRLAAARNASVWATTGGGVAAGVALVVSGSPAAGGEAVDAGASTLAALGAGLVALPPLTVASLGLAAALAIYGAGLLSSVGPSVPGGPVFPPKTGERE